jgi:hypothetical protein
MSDRDIADCEWAARAVADMLRRCLLALAAEMALRARLIK